MGRRSRRTGRHLVLGLVIGSIMAACLAGCGNADAGSTKRESANPVDQVIEEQMTDNDVSSEEKTSENPAGGDDIEETKIEETKTGMDGGNTPEQDVDYDLTEMDSDMVYATVYQMMMYPDEYVGKTFKMDGFYDAVFYEPTGQYYHYCVIRDAMACCAQGMEFIWGDGSRVYPDDYPEKNTDIIVEGVFETYQEEGDSHLYCRLSHASVIY